METRKLSVHMQLSDEARKLIGMVLSQPGAYTMEEGPGPEPILTPGQTKEECAARFQEMGATLQAREITVEEAYVRIAQEIAAADGPGSYRDSWQANIAMAIYDDVKEHGGAVDGEMGNRVAEKIVRSFFLASRLVEQLGTENMTDQSQTVANLTKERDHYRDAEKVADQANAALQECLIQAKAARNEARNVVLYVRNQVEALLERLKIDHRTDVADDSVMIDCWLVNLEECILSTRKWASGKADEKYMECLAQHVNENPDKYPNLKLNVELEPMRKAVKDFRGWLGYLIQEHIDAGIAIGEPFQVIDMESQIKATEKIGATIKGLYNLVLYRQGVIEGFRGWLRYVMEKYQLSSFNIVDDETQVAATTCIEKHIDYLAEIHDNGNKRLDELARKSHDATSGLEKENEHLKELLKRSGDAIQKCATYIVRAPEGLGLPESVAWLYGENERNQNELDWLKGYFARSGMQDEIFAAGNVARFVDRLLEKEKKFDERPKQPTVTINAIDPEAIVKFISERPDIVVVALSKNPAAVKKLLAQPKGGK